MNEEQLKQIVDAKRQILEGATEIWNARLEILRQAGDYKGMLDHLDTPVEQVADGWGCNGNCDCASPSLTESSIAKSILRE